MNPHKARTPHSINAAVLKAAGALSLGVIADDTGVTESAVYKWTDPDGNADISARKAVLVDARYVVEGHGHGPILEAYRAELERHVERLGRMPGHKPADPLDRVCQIVHETSEAIDIYRASVTRRSVIPPAAGNLALKEIAEAMEALDGAYKDIEAHMKPKPLEAAE